MYFFMLLTGRPSVLFRTDLFLPYRFTLNNVIPSLGHLTIIGLLAALFSVIFYRHFQFPECKRQKELKDYVLLTLLLTGGALLFTFCDFVFSELVLNSNINFETYRVLELSVASFAGFATVLLLMVFPVAFMLKVFKAIKLFSPGTIVLSVITSGLVPVIIYYNYPEKYIPVVLFYLAVTGVLGISGIKRTGMFNLTVIFSLIFGLYSLYRITVLSDQKRMEALKIQAVSFSTENDPEAEHLLLDLWPVLNNDTTLSGMMMVEYFNKTDFDRISEHLQERYFTGYWRNFNFSIVPCRNDEPIQLGTGSELNENCFNFFEERIRLNGHKLTGTEFYFIDNQGGRSYYIGKIYYRTAKGIINGLFIELYSDINVFQSGYSELLLDKKYHGYAGLKDYSFAKYINGEIVLRNGEFPYDKTDSEYVDENSEYKFFMKDGYKHILYKNGNATIVISRPRLTFEDLIISFAYLFAFILLFFNLMLLIVRRPDLKSTFIFNFRQKLQLSFLSVLFFSFLLIGAVVTSFIVRQYQSKHNENLKEKLNSIYIELESNIGNEKNISSDWRSSSYSSLNELLIKFSNVFMTDINLYDKYGFLVATSRPEIFYRDLTSERINNIAFNNLKVLTKSEYSQKEKIGSLEYISTYVPFFSAENKVLAYLNLPYFRAQSILAKEISNLIVAVINFTILLIVITMSLVVFISGRLTSPLTMLGEGLSTVGVGKKSEHLSYKGRDEIGELVKQYNRMVDEIEDSANKLANSEREYAWREMAKQIAHEIKNPLTPMKLNIQQLFKSWNDKAPGFAKKLERFTKNQIEYIDNLSSIASAFSSFAKMPGTNRIELNLLDHIKTTLELFKNTDNVIFLPHWPHESEIIVYADKEQLNSIFSNLFKNGIQSIPPERKGVIGINLEIRENKVIVAISDNGTGIPQDLKKKLFTPNFTTKSSGMGLGLSIVKKYIESANGRIWFESEPDKGSVFYVELPLLHTVERPL
jgi:signal transduction histidine kinase